MAAPLHFFRKKQKILFRPHGSFCTPRFGLRQIFGSREANCVTSIAFDCIIRSILKF